MRLPLYPHAPRPSVSDHLHWNVTNSAGAALFAPSRSRGPPARRRPRPRIAVASAIAAATAEHAPCATGAVNDASSRRGRRSGEGLLATMLALRRCRHRPCVPSAFSSQIRSRWRAPWRTAPPLRRWVHMTHAAPDGCMRLHRRWPLQLPADHLSRPVRSPAGPNDTARTVRAGCFVSTRHTRTHTHALLRGSVAVDLVWRGDPPALRSMYGA